MATTPTPPAALRRVVAAAALLAGPAVAPAGAPRAGDAAPDFKLEKLDGRPVTLGDYRHKVLVIAFGSHTSPTFRAKAAALDALRESYGFRARFLVVYTREAHPAGEWDVARNAAAGVSVPAHADADARAAAARAMRDALGLKLDVAPDGMEDAVTEAYGGFPNAAVVLGRDGTIIARQRWLDPSGLGRLIDDAIARPTE